LKPVPSAVLFLQDAKDLPTAVNGARLLTQDPHHIGGESATNQKNTVNILAPIRYEFGRLSREAQKAMASRALVMIFSTLIAGIHRMNAPEPGQHWPDTCLITGARWQSRQTEISTETRRGQWESSTARRSMCLSDSWRLQPSCRLAAITTTSRVKVLPCAGNPHSRAGARARRAEVHAVDCCSTQPHQPDRLRVWCEFLPVR